MVTLARRHAAPLLLAALGLAACARAGIPAPDPSSKRSLSAGDVVGFRDDYGSHAWLGLPFAEPPVGELRWRAPRAAARWRGVREALSTGEACPQYASVYAGAARGETGVIGSEDCLALDVWAPPFEPGAVPAAEARLPVMVWIHGGGHSIGRAGFYQGGNLARTQDVVVVAVQYRLGPLGWLRHAALREGADANDASGNFGTLDLIRALEWVRENVAAFGGDPGNITIFGESAGGTNVLSLLLAPRAAGLFHRAILQSAGFGTASPAQAENFRDDPEAGSAHSANEVLAQLLVNEGAAQDRAEARARLAGMPLAEVASWLRAKSPADLLAGYTEHGQGMLFFPAVFRDGGVLPSDAPQAALERRAAHRVPVLFGTNRDENKLFMAFEPTLARWRFGLFPEPLDPELYQARAEAQARAWKARGADEPARALSVVQDAPVFAYRWDWDEEPGLPGLYDGGFVIGAAHGLEIPFVFGHWDLGPETRTLFTAWNREGREALAAAMMSYWAEFAYRGSPGRGRAGELPEWKPWDPTPGAPKYAVLDTPAGGGIRMASETWTLERVVADVLADPRLSRARDRCGVLHALARWEDLSLADYATVGGGVCRDFAFDAYPWTDVAVASE
jgi:para-nitrobenzyl esterase